MATFNTDISINQQRSTDTTVNVADVTNGAKASRATFARITAGLFLFTWATVLMNVVLFPLFDATFTYARDISITVEAVALIAVGAIATFRPQALHVRTLDIVAAICLIFGAISLAWALTVPGQIALLVISSSIFAVGRAGLIIVLGLSAVKLSKQQIPMSVVMAFTTTGIASVITEFLPIWAGVALYLMAMLIAFVLVFQLAQPMLEFSAQCEAPADIAVTRPSTFLPLQSSLFVCIFVFSIAFGFSLRFGEPSSSAQMAFIRLLPPLLIALYAFSGKKFNADALLGIATVLIVAGFYLATYQTIEIRNIGNTIMSSGNTVFQMIMWYLLMILAAKKQRRRPCFVFMGFWHLHVRDTFGCPYWGNRDRDHGTVEHIMGYIFCCIPCCIFDLRHFRYAPYQPARNR